jgi:hypothetical protein
VARKAASDDDKQVFGFAGLLVSGAILLRLRREDLMGCKNPLPSLRLAGR